MLQYFSATALKLSDPVNLTKTLISISLDYTYVIRIELKLQLDPFKELLKTS